MPTNYTSAECPTCLTTFRGLPVESDGESTYALLESRPCAQCGALLCEACARFACDGCGDVFCLSHVVKVEDGTPRPLQCCAACAAECEQMELPLVAVCPECASDDIVITEMYFGVSNQTGYLDAGERFSCRACGAAGDAEELGQAVERVERIAPRSVGRAAAERSA